MAEDRSATSSHESADSSEEHAAAIDRYYQEHAAKETESNQSLLYEALGVTSRGTCIRHPNCPVLIQSPIVESEYRSSSNNMPQLHVMSCRICFSEEKSVGIRQRKSFAAVVQHLQNMSLLPIAEEGVDHLPESRRSSMGTNSSNDHSTDSSAGSGSEPQKVLESILKRLAQVQNWILRQKEKEVVSLQMHIHRLEQRLVESERLSQEQKQTVKALRRTIQQDLKIIKTMATQKKMEMESGSQAASRSAAGAPSPYQPPRWQQTQSVDMMDEEVSEVTMPTVLANWTPPAMATPSAPPNSNNATPQTSNTQIQGKDESGSGRRRKKKSSNGGSSAGSPSKSTASGSRRSGGTKTSEVPALQQFRPPKRVPTPKVNEHKSGPSSNIAGSNHSNSSGSNSNHAGSRPPNPAEIYHPGRQGTNPAQPFVWSAGQSVGMQSSTGASAGTSVETPAVLSSTGASMGSARTQGTIRTLPVPHEDTSVANSATNIEWNPNQPAGAPSSGSTRDIYVAPPEVRSGPGYWNDRDVSLASDPNRLFASFRGGLLDIPKCPPQPPQYAEMGGGIKKDKIVLDPNERKALRMPVRALSRDNSQASGDLVEVRQTPNQKKNLLRPIPMAPFLVQSTPQGDDVEGDQEADDKEIPLQHMAETLSAVPVSRKIDDKRPDFLFGNGEKSKGGYNDSANIAEAAAVALSEDDPPSPDGDRYSMRPKRVYTVPVGMQTRRISTTSASIEDEDDNTTGRMDRTVLTATYSIETMETRETSVEGSSSADQKTAESGSTFADHAMSSGPPAADDGRTGSSVPLGTSHAGTGHTFSSQTVRTMTNSSGGNSMADGDEETVDTFANEDNATEAASLATGTDKFLFNVTGASCADHYGDGGTYSGTILVTQGLPHGEGIMKYETGRVYEGEWVSGQWHGRGSLLNANGDSYQGEFHLDARHGKGIYTWDNGDVYTGEFRGDKRHGQGTFSFHNGNLYEGEFVDGMFEGRGRYEFNGGYYEGEWKEGRYNGAGELMYSNGAKYTGEFRNSVAHGYGTEITPDGEKRRGVWDNGQPAEYYE